MNTEEIILEELREFRRQVTPLIEDLSQRVATVETKVDYVYGDTQPGKLHELDTRLDDVEHHNWLWSGAIGVITFLGTLVGSHYWHK